MEKLYSTKKIFLELCFVEFWGQELREENGTINPIIFSQLKNQRKAF